MDPHPGPLTTHSPPTGLLLGQHLAVDLELVCVWLFSSSMKLCTWKSHSGFWKLVNVGVFFKLKKKKITAHYKSHI